MSLNQVRKLLQTSPSDLYIGVSIELVIDWGQQRTLVKSVKKVFDLYCEASEFDLSDKEKRVLNERLVTAAGRLQELIDYDDFNVAGKHQRYARADQDLFHEIAAELKLQPQQLQALTF